MRPLKWIQENKSWLFSGAGLSIIGLVVVVVGFVYRFRSNIWAFLKVAIPTLWNHFASQVFIPYWLLYLLSVFSFAGIVLLIWKSTKIFAKELEQIQIEILKELARDERPAHKELARIMKINSVKTKYHLRILVKKGYVSNPTMANDRGLYFGLKQKGREYLVKNNLI